MTVFCLTPPLFMEKKTLKVSLTFQWELDPKMWSELKQHQKTVEKDLETRTKYDPLNMFYVLNNLGVPSLENLKLNGVSRKVKL